MLRLVSFAYMPSPLPRQVRWSLFARPSPSSAAFPVITVRSAPAITFSGPAQRSLTLRPARSRSRLSDPFHRRLRQLRCLRCRFDCYRVERTSSRAGLAPAEVQRLFTAHCYANHEQGSRVATRPIDRMQRHGIMLVHVEVLSDCESSRVSRADLFLEHLRRSVECVSTTCWL